MAGNRPPIHVGDHVRDRERDDDTRMLVVGLGHLAANEYEFKAGQTIADANPDHPPAANVIECQFVKRTDMALPDGEPYAYPRPRLELVHPIHHIEAESEQSGGDDDGD